MSKSNLLENELLDHVLGNSSYSPPATVYVALFTTSPSDSSGGVEVSGGGYARVAVTNNLTNWPAAVSGSKSNGTVISFPTATAAWGTIVAFALMTAPTGGDILYWGAVNPNVSVPSGADASFAVGALVITED